jgi:hypothetical protein
MLIFPNLVAVLAMLLPPGSGEMRDPIVFGSSAVQRTVERSEASDLFFSPAHLPSPDESFFEPLEETAFDEEDSTRVEDHGIAPLAFLDFEAPKADDLNSYFLPASPHAQSLVISPILRC